MLDLGGASRQAGSLILASASFLAANLGYVICVAVASRDGVGEATIYAYAYFTAALLVATTAISSAMVRTPKLIAGAQRTEATITEATTTYRFTLVLVGPALGLIAVAGAPIADFLLGGAFDEASAERLVITLLCLSGWVLGSAAAVFAIVDLLARGRRAPLVAVAVGQLVLLVPLAIAGRAAGGVEGVAVAQSVVLLGATWIQLRLAFGKRTRAATASMLATTLRAAAVMAIAFAPGIAIALTSDGSTAGTAAAIAVSLPLAFVATRLAWPAETRTILSLLPGR